VVAALDLLVDQPPCKNTTIGLPDATTVASYRRLVVMDARFGFGSYTYVGVQIMT
jgi:hypothetical protein